MKTTLSLLAQFTATVFAAESTAGFVHCLEDAYIRDHTPLSGRLVEWPNTIHHHYPRYLTRHNWWQSSWDLVLLAAVLVAGAWSCGLLTWRVWLFALIAANANEFHKWEHRTHAQGKRTAHLLSAGHQDFADIPASRAASHRSKEQPLLHHDEFVESGS